MLISEEFDGMWRYLRLLLSLALLTLTGCLPPNFFENLLGNSIYGVTGFLLNDALNTLIPPQ
jgi:hypothetical protein